MTIKRSAKGAKRFPELTVVYGPSAGSEAEVDLIPVAQAGKRPTEDGDSSLKPCLPDTAFARPYDEVLGQLGEVFSGKAGTVQFVRFGAKRAAGVAARARPRHLAFLGMGPADKLTAEKARQAGGHAWSRLCAEKCRSAALDADAFGEDEGARLRLLQGFCEGLLLASYRFQKYKKPADPRPTAPEKIILITASRSRSEVTALERMAADARMGAEATALARDWSNEPSNFGTPRYFADEARRIAKKNGLKCRILGPKDIARERMGLLAAVAQGSRREGRVVVVEHTPLRQKYMARTSRTVVLVGKGITFDSGGVSIKPSARMEEMKYDMTGAATVMGAVLLAAKKKTGNRVIGVLAFAENMPDGAAVQPGNVLTSRAGKTVEIISTDAEGRLILADALDFAQDVKALRGTKADVVVDVATLTGAISVALGKHCCGMMTNDDGVARKMVESALECGERVWEMPVYDEYLDDLKSEFADLRNSAGDAYGGASRGAVFLKQFVRKSMPWAHLDIAGTAANLSHLSYCPKKGASGAYVRTLAHFAANWK